VIVEESTPVTVALPWSYLKVLLTGFVQAAITASRAVF